VSARSPARRGKRPRSAPRSCARELSRRRSRRTWRAVSARKPSSRWARWTCWSSTSPSAVETGSPWRPWTIAEPRSHRGGSVADVLARARSSAGHRPRRAGGDAHDRK
jgi:hypothetical protein